MHLPGLSIFVHLLGSKFDMNHRNSKSRDHVFRRRVGFETLEKRALLVAEAETFNLARSFDATGLLGNPTASVNWGDGSPATAVAVSGGTNTGTVRISFDYSLDKKGFLADGNRKTILDAAARIVTSRLRDNLTAIQPTGTNTWTASTLDPETNATVDMRNMNIAANEIVVFVGARELGGNQLGSGGPGGLAASGSPGWLNNVLGRGQAGAITATKTDVGPWGGTLAFDISTNWYFGLDQAGLQPGQQDFVTVAVHELTHLLGFGTAASWNNLKSGSNFTGPKSRAAYDAGGNVPLSADGGHWLESITDSGRKTLMGSVIIAGVRDTLTGLDLAALDDIGWDVVDTNASINASHVYADNGIYPITVTYRGSTVGQFTDTASANITNANPTLSVVANQSIIRDQVLTLTNIGSISDPGFANPAATPPTSETFPYTINWGDGSAVDTGTATLDRIGNATTKTLASFDGSHTYRSTGTFTVTVAIQDDDGGTARQTFQVSVAAPPELSLQLNRTSIVENATGEAATLTVRRTAPASTSATTVNLISSDTTEATVPASVVIPAGQLSVTVPVTAVDDALLDATQAVTLTASGTGLVSGTTALSVTDFEALTASLSTATVNENAPAGTIFLIIARPNNGAAVTVTISGNVSTEITIPSSATIDAGSRQVRVPLDPINDADPERSLALAYRVTAPGYIDDILAVVLLDDEKPLFQNPIDRFNADGLDGVKALDALKVINFLSRRRENLDLNPDAEAPNGFFADVNGDYRITALDALQVINEIARRRRQTIASSEQQVNDKIAAPPLENRTTTAAEATNDVWIAQLF